MESIDILTGQNVTLKYEPASLLRRGCALLLDFFFTYLYVFIVFYLLFLINDRYFFDDSTLLIIAFFILLLPALGYQFIFESITGGKTPGKMIAKIKVANLDGSTPGLISYFLRWILLPVDLFPSGGIGALFIIFSHNHQRLGDMAASTVVIRTVSKATFDLKENFYEFSDEYQTTFREADQLTEGQIQFISNLLQSTKKHSTADDSIHELATKVKEKLNITSNLDDRAFLETIVRDYNYYASLGV